MTKLETSDPETSQFLRETLSVNKTSIPFSAIGPDHAIEHENRAMKVQGGIKGIANKLSSLDFLIMPEMKNIIEQVSSFFGIRTNKRYEHYQLTGGTQQRIAPM